MKRMWHGSGGGLIGELPRPLKLERLPSHGCSFSHSLSTVTLIPGLRDVDHGIAIPITDMSTRTLP
jgi:hypothetical protein